VYGPKFSGRSRHGAPDVEHAEVICTRHAAGLVRQERLDGGPFVIGEFVAHDWRLRFGSLNHAPGKTRVEADANALILLPLSGAQPTCRDLLLASPGRK